MGTSFSLTSHIVSYATKNLLNSKQLRKICITLWLEHWNNTQPKTVCVKRDFLDASFLDAQWTSVGGSSWLRLPMKRPHQRRGTLLTCCSSRMNFTGQTCKGRNNASSSPCVSVDPRKRNIFFGIENNEFSYNKKRKGEGKSCLLTSTYYMIICDSRGKPRRWMSFLPFHSWGHRFPGNNVFKITSW